jgi:DNA repair protein RadA/Sms
MAKRKVVFACSECGCEAPRWLGRCPDCGEYNTLVEQTISFRAAASVSRRSAADSAPVMMADTSGLPARSPVGIEEFDRVLGGGLVAGSVVLLAGDPGIGKSTLLLQACANLAAGGSEVLYISAEESVHQVQSRAQRLGEIPPALLVAAEEDVEIIEEHLASRRPALAVVDSIQAVSDSELGSAPGTISQVRQCAGRLLRLAKEGGLPLFLVGHVTKEGMVAGPRLLEHMVDTVLYLEGERRLGYRILRAQKNRFGSTEEVGIFEMTETGLVEVEDPSGAFLAEYRPGASGTALSIVIEGSRPLLVETQGLISRAAGPPRRACSGPDYNRVCLILAVLEKQGRLPISVSDVFVNIPGGLRVVEPAADLAIALSLISSHREKPLPEGTCCIGEVGLTGEIRAVSRLERRLAEAARLGLKRAVVPAMPVLRNFPAGVEVIPVENLKQAMEKTLKSG